MRCYDTCACPCEQESLGVATNDLSLVVAEDPVAQLITTPISSHPALYPAPHSLESELSENVAAWRVWEAPKPSGNGDQSAKPSPRKSPVIRDSHRPVNLSNGVRQTGPSSRAILHSRRDISAQMGQKRSQSESLPPVLNNPEGIVHQLDKGSSLVPPRSNQNTDTHARGTLHLLPPLARDVPYGIDDSTRVIGSAQANVEIYHNEQDTKTSSSRSQLVIMPGRSYSGAPRPTNNTEPTASMQMETTTGPVSASQTRLFVSGIVEADSGTSLRHLFTQFGTVLDTVAMNDTTRVTSGHPKRFGFVTMASPGQADAAIAGLHGTRRHGQALSVQKAKPDPNSSNPGPNNPRKHSVPTSKSKENNPGSEPPLKKYTPEIKAQSKEFDQVLTEINHSPSDANVEHTLRQTHEPSNGKGDGVTTIVTRKQEETPTQEDDLISFD